MIDNDVSRDVSAVLERRIRTVAISPQVLVAMCKEGNHIAATCIEGLPADALLWEASYDVFRRVFLLDVSSPSFEPTPPGEAYPALPVTFRSEDR